MSEPCDDSDESKLDQRLDRAKQSQSVRPETGQAATSGSGIGVAAQSGVEFVVVVVVAGGIGFLIDRWLHTAPALMLVMLVLGFGAGLANIYRALNGLPSGATNISRKADKDDS